ncbi:MAG: PilZ domain-containing protein [Candidatus Omnitrophica bacterium]|nr:PilZ domain-containing protein [Candidatus Omnitrophota bacterium]
MNDDYSDVERRRHKRVPVNFILRYRIQKPLEVVIRIGNMEVNAVMIDLSEGGMAIITDYDIPSGTELTLKFTLVNTYTQDQSQRNKVVEALGRVAYIMPMYKDNRLGISFTEISKHNVSTILEFINLAPKPAPNSNI